VVSRDRDLVRPGRQRQPTKLLEADRIEEEGVAAPLVDRHEAGAAGRVVDVHEQAGLP
jgi:hypothetical protein